MSAHLWGHGQLHPVGLRARDPVPARARQGDKGTAVGISSNWLWNFFVVMVTPTLLTDLKWKGCLIFMCLNFAFVPLVYFCYPETSNLTLEEIDWLFLGGEQEGPVQMSKRVAKQHGWGDGEEGVRGRPELLFMTRRRRRRSPRPSAWRSVLR